MLRRYLAWILQQDANHGLYAYDGVVMIELRTAQHVWPILILFSQKGNNPTLAKEEELTSE